MSRNFFSIFKKRSTPVNSYAMNGYSTPFGSPAVPNKRRLNFGLKNFKLSKQMLAVLIIGIIAVLGFGFWFKKAADNLNPGVLGANNSGSSEQIAPPYATKYIDRELSLPIRNEKGDKVSEFKFVVVDAELTREIVVKGQKATSVKGRTFLILNLKVINDGKQMIKVNTRDYIRLNVNGNSEFLAPDIHNDTVEAQPISTKPTRVGFAIDDTSKNIKLQMGEIEGEKQYVDLDF